MFEVGYLFLQKLMQIADYITYLINNVQQDINNTRKRLRQNKVKILLK